MRIGVLALQGDFREHLEMLASLGVAGIEVRRKEQLFELTHLIIPGGESTAMSKLMESQGLVGAITDALQEGLAIFGTCAGMIISAKEIHDGRPDQVCLGAIDIAVLRNGFGRQVNSFETLLSVKGLVGGPMPAAFIRAPVVTRVGPDVEVLSFVEYNFGLGVVSVPVVCRNDRVLVTSFHPEVTNDARLHELFVSSFGSAI